VVVRRAEPTEIVLVAGDGDTAAGLDRERDDVRIDDHGRAGVGRCQHPADNASEVAIRVATIEGSAFAGEAGVEPSRDVLTC
jgi:hypothetical protein